MRIRILAIGKIKEAWLREGIEMYRTRLSRFLDLQVEELAEAPTVEEEGERILRRLSPEERVLLLDLHGKEMDSLTFARVLRQEVEAGGARLSFVIGGSDGLSEALRQRSHRRICFSQLTFTHQMARLLLVEQIYRACKIQAGENYHK